MQNVSAGNVVFLTSKCNRYVCVEKRSVPNIMKTMSNYIREEFKLWFLDMMKYYLFLVVRTTEHLIDCS